MHLFPKKFILSLVLLILFLGFFSMMTSSYNRNEENSPIIINFPILATEVDEDLQLNANSTVEKVILEFTRKGGALIRADQGIVKAIILPGDVVYPACSAGACRSQALWALLKEREDKIMLFPPHATRYGFDPYNNKMNWHRSRKEHATPDEFALWAGEPKATRAGFDVFGHLWDEKNVTSEQLEQIREYYDVNYYGAQNKIKGRRHVYIGFDKNTHAIVHRLNQSNTSLENVVVYHFPLQDLISNPLDEWNTPPRSHDSYEKFSKILLEHVDFSHL